MSLRDAVFIPWGIFIAVWVLAALDAKPGPRRTGRGPGLLLVVAFVVLRVFKVNLGTIHNEVLQLVGLALAVAGIAVAVWARFYLGRNWGMPMTRKEEPELVTSGPYRFVRHPIYSGILLAILGTALGTDLYWLLGLAILAVYFAYSATVEERAMSQAFPTAYPSYRARTKKLIPFVL